MPWYNYLFCFFGGAFVANFFPHFVRGVTGAEFPTPFAKPPGRGMSPAPVNVLWALFNLAVGFLLLRTGTFSTEKSPRRWFHRIWFHGHDDEPRIFPKIGLSESLGTL